MGKDGACDKWGGVKMGEMGRIGCGIWGGHMERNGCVTYATNLVCDKLPL